MPVSLHALCLSAREPDRVARFWAGLLGREPGPDPYVLLPVEEHGIALHVLPGGEEKTGQNRVHLDLTSSSDEDQSARVQQALALGGRHVDVGQRPEEGHVVLGDVEGDEFCVVEADNRFLAGCGLVGAVNCDGLRQVGVFWSAALGWPLVWDADEETAVQSPHGGPKITWSGPPLMPRHGPDRYHLDVVVDPGVDLADEVDALLSLGASRSAVAAHVDGSVVLEDPDGNAFCVLPSGS